MVTLRSLARLLLAAALALAQGLTAHAQTLTNPAFEQDVATYAIQETGKTNRQNVSIALSQDFQTVYAGDDANGQQQSRALLDFSTCCPSTNSTQDILTWAADMSIPLDPIALAPKMALIKRGGCAWSSKVHLAKQISDTRNLSVTAILIYDDTPRPSANFTLQRLSSENTISLPTYNDKLTPDRQIWQMQDNDIASAVMDMPVYFVPFDYGDTMRSLIQSTAQASLANSNRTQIQVWQLMAHLTYLKASDSDGQGRYPPVSTSGFLSYAIALAIIFLLSVLAGLLVMRWRRIRQERERQDQEFMARGAYRLRRVQPLPVTILQSFPVTGYSTDIAKNASCPICLDDFDTDTEVRTLPCGHCFCVQCIDPWLTAKSTLCPICKHNCLPEELRRRSEDEEDESTEASATQETASLESHRPTAVDRQPCASPAAVTESHPPPNRRPSARQHTQSGLDNDRHLTPSSSTSVPPTTPPTQP